MKDATQVLIISPVPPPVHGASLATEILLKGLRLQGTPKVLHINARFSENIEELQGGSIKKLARLAKYLGQTAVQIITRRPRAVVMTPTFYPKPFLKDALFIWLTWLLRVPARVAWFHTNYTAMGYDDQPSWFRKLAKATFRRCTHYVCVSDSLCPVLPDFMPANRRFAIANGVEVKTIPSLPPEEIAPAPLKVLYLSNMDEAKGWRILFGTAERLLTEGHEIAFDFYGAPAKGCSEKEIRRTFEGGRFPEYIRYRGFADSETKTRAFTRTDLLCFPSLNEAFPLTILEAMAHSLPIVASQVGAISDALVDGKGGILVNPGDGVALYHALKNLADHGETRRQMGKFNRSRYAEHYTAEAFVRRWIAFCEDHL
ncbi:MAG: glycosyltransferase family 4 protein [Luteolibacter sp.]